eukprot:135523_1
MADDDACGVNENDIFIDKKEKTQDNNNEITGSNRTKVMFWWCFVGFCALFVAAVCFLAGRQYGNLEKMNVHHGTSSIYHDNVENAFPTKSKALGAVYDMHSNEFSKLASKKVSENAIGTILAAHNNTKIDCNEYRPALRKVFNMYDIDNDNALSQDEFTEYIIDIAQFDHVFDILDWDYDGVVSFRDVVTFFRLVHHVDPENDFLVRRMKTRVSKDYNYEYVEGDLVWFEYAADTFFEDVDQENNGYITKDNLYHIFSKLAYVTSDANQNGEISFKEFFDKTCNPKSYEFILHETWYDNDDNMKQVVELYKKHEDSFGVELTLCPTLTKPIVNTNRRRLCDGDSICGTAHVLSTTACFGSLMLGFAPVCLASYGIASVTCIGGYRYCNYEAPAPTVPVDCNDMDQCHNRCFRNYCLDCDSNCECDSCMI